MKSTFSTIFYLKRQAVKTDGTVPVMGRITIDGTQTQFSCKLTIDPKLWDTKSGRATGRSSVALETNRMLDKIRVKINSHYHEILDRENFVTAEKVKNAFLGLEYRQTTLLKIFEKHNMDYEKLCNAGMKAISSYRKYVIVYKHLKEFLYQRYHVKDIAVKELTISFITDFEMFLRVDKHLKINSTWIYTSVIKTMVYIAINNGWLTRDPFAEYEAPKEETTRSFLSRDELNTLINAKVKNSKQELVRDLFVFCCFTGLSFIDLKNLKQENLRTYFDEHLWIYINRQKTGVQSNIRLLDIPLSILKKYEKLRTEDKVFPVPPYTNCLNRINQIVKLNGINKRITWHQSRHTMATEVCLTNNVPIETVSSILGHKNIKTTQVYAKITKEKLNKDMENLACQLNNIQEYSSVKFQK